MDGKRPTIASLHGMVAAGHPAAVQAGAKLLAAGGNAFDAAVATAAALGVVEPGISGLAGMGMATCYIAAEQHVRTLDFVPRLPAAYAGGGLGCGTPGNLAGWCELAKAHGRKKLHDIFAPAVALARDGHMLIEFAGASTIKARHALQELPFFEDWRSTYLGHGSGAPGPGHVMCQPDLARTLETIASEGPEHFYRGALGRKVIAHLQSRGGCVTMPDMAAVSPLWLEPLAAAYRGLEVHAPPLPGDGARFLRALRILDGFDLAAMERGGADELDTVWRAIRLAAEAGGSLPDESVATLRARLRAALPVETPQPPDPVLTSSFAVVDREGNAVCITHSLGGLFGCGVVVPGTGICLNNLLPREPPGAGLALPLAPAIATRDGKPLLLLGSPGGDGGSQAQLQVLVQHLDHGLAIQDAIEAPRARLGAGQLVQAERRMPAAAVEALRRRGHVVEAAADWTDPVGAVQAIAIDQQSGDPQTAVATGGADPRRDGYVAVP